MGKARKRKKNSNMEGKQGIIGRRSVEQKF